MSAEHYCYQGRVVRIEVRAREGGGWCWTYSIDGDGAWCCDDGVATSCEIARAAARLSAQFEVDQMAHCTQAMAVLARFMLQ